MITKADLVRAWPDFKAGRHPRPVLVCGCGECSADPGDYWLVDLPGASVVSEGPCPGCGGLMTLGYYPVTELVVLAGGDK